LPIAEWPITELTIIERTGRTITSTPPECFRIAGFVLGGNAQDFYAARWLFGFRESE
jgi:hypothetical protein